MSVYVCMYIYIYICVHVHTQIYYKDSYGDEFISLCVVGIGIIPKMAAILSAQPHGSWARVFRCTDASSIAKLKILNIAVSSVTTLQGDDFFDSLRHAELAASVLHEICRYRSGARVHVHLYSKTENATKARTWCSRYTHT